MKLYDDYLDIHLKNCEEFTSLKDINSDIKLYISIGGWIDSQSNAGAYKAMFTSLTKRKNFAR